MLKVKPACTNLHLESNQFGALHKENIYTLAYFGWYVAYLDM